MGGISGRLKLAARRRRCGGEAPAEGGRVPPGQRVVEHFPVLDLGHRPAIRPEDWRLEVRGLVERPGTLDLEALRSLGEVERALDVHCVTGWSRLGLRWGGIPVARLLDAAGVRPDARHATAHGADGYCANLPLALLRREDALLAWAVDGELLPREHGGPVRLVVASRYFWKSVKWITALELHAEDRPGFWEQRGYHNEGDPWKEERYG